MTAGPIGLEVTIRRTFFRNPNRPANFSASDWAPSVVADEPFNNRR